jgi:hypothetical protein
VDDPFACRQRLLLVAGTDIPTDYCDYLIGLHGKVKDKSSSIVTHGFEDITDEVD